MFFFTFIDGDSLDDSCELDYEFTSSIEGEDHQEETIDMNAPHRIATPQNSVNPCQPVNSGQHHNNEMDVSHDQSSSALNKNILEKNGNDLVRNVPVLGNKMNEKNSVSDYLLQSYQETVLKASNSRPSYSTCNEKRKLKQNLSINESKLNDQTLDNRQEALISGNKKNKLLFASGPGTYNNKYNKIHFKLIDTDSQLTAETESSKQNMEYTHKKKNKAAPINSVSKICDKMVLNNSVSISEKAILITGSVEDKMPLKKNPEILFKTKEASKFNNEAKKKTLKISMPMKDEPLCKQLAVRKRYKHNSSMQEWQEISMNSRIENTSATPKLLEKVLIKPRLYPFGPNLKYKKTQNLTCRHFSETHNLSHQLLFDSKSANADIDNLRPVTKYQNSIKEISTISSKPHASLDSNIMVTPNESVPAVCSVSDEYTFQRSCQIWHLLPQTLIPKTNLFELSNINCTSNTLTMDGCTPIILLLKKSSSNESSLPYISLTPFFTQNETVVNLIKLNVQKKTLHIIINTEIIDVIPNGANVILIENATTMILVYGITSDQLRPSATFPYLQNPLIEIIYPINNLSQCNETDKQKPFKFIKINCDSFILDPVILPFSLLLNRLLFRHSSSLMHNECMQPLVNIGPRTDLSITHPTKSKCNYTPIKKNKLFSNCKAVELINKDKSSNHTSSNNKLSSRTGRNGNSTSPASSKSFESSSYESISYNHNKAVANVKKNILLNNFQTSHKNQKLSSSILSKESNIKSSNKLNIMKQNCRKNQNLGFAKLHEANDISKKQSLQEMKNWLSPSKCKPPVDNEIYNTETILKGGKKLFLSHKKNKISHFVKCDTRSSDFAIKSSTKLSKQNANIPLYEKPKTTRLKTIKEISSKVHFHNIPPVSSDIDYSLLRSISPRGPMTHHVVTSSSVLEMPHLKDKQLHRLCASKNVQYSDKTTHSNNQLHSCNSEKVNRLCFNSINCNTKSCASCSCYGIKIVNDMETTENIPDSKLSQLRAVSLSEISTPVEQSSTKSKVKIKSGCTNLRNNYYSSNNQLQENDAPSNTCNATLVMENCNQKPSMLPISSELCTPLISKKQNSTVSNSGNQSSCTKLPLQLTALECYALPKQPSPVKDRLQVLKHLYQPEVYEKFGQLFRFVYLLSLLGNN